MNEAQCFLVSYSLYFLFGLLVLTVAAAFLFYKLKWLTLGGTITAFFVGLSLTITNSFFSILVFFIVGTLASKLNRNQKSDIKHSKPRDAVQVLANGGIAMILSILSLVLLYFENDFNHEKLVPHLNILGQLVLISISVSMCDTLGSEIGMRYSKIAYNPITFRPMKKGLSGAISWEGFLGGILGTLILCLISPYYWKGILFGGVIGSKIDSYLGLFLQAKYEDGEGELTDVPTGKLVSGFRWCTNDMVNFMSNLITVIIFYFILI